MTNPTSHTSAPRPDGHDKRDDVPPAPTGPILSAGELWSVLQLDIDNPHAVLGAHPTPWGVVVRARHPLATGARVLADDGARWEMKRISQAPDDGLFELLVPERHEVFPYRLEWIWADGTTTVRRDPYSFLPTLGELDIHLLSEGRHERLYDVLGAHVRTVESFGKPTMGVSFAVWAPHARSVSVVGNWNGWDGRVHPMRRMGATGIWELFIPGLEAGAVYKFELRSQHGGGNILKADPMAFRTELPPNTASVVFESHHTWKDAGWVEAREAGDPWRSPMSIYEVHLGSWRRVPEEENRSLTYRELAKELGDYVQEMGFTHIELMPVQEHPFGGSWGYQLSGYYAPTSRYGDPDDFRYFVDEMHRRGIGVLIDWVPAHFPKDEWALGRFDGSAVYEHLDPREGEHPDWGTYVFNFGRNEVRNFLVANALYWIEQFHIDGLRVDAVASMLYRDYSRKHGEWVPNAFGGRENLEAVSFMRELNEVVHRTHPGVLMVAEESTAWPGVSRPTYLGGLGFGFKWNMGWMHDTLLYFSKDPIHRRFHHNNLTFGALYAWSENFILPLSHDEVVHGKKSLLDKMPGDRWQKFANLRALFGYMFANPGKKLLFMGAELGQWWEWNYASSLDWHLLAEAENAGVQRLLRDLNHAYRAHPALWEADVDPQGFEWVDANAADDNVLSFVRVSPKTGERLVCVCNLAPIVRENYRIGFPHEGRWRELINTDAGVYAGSNVGNMGEVLAEPIPFHGRPGSASLRLPPLATLWFVPAP